jgi:hypothetical protein
VGDLVFDLIAIAHKHAGLPPTAGSTAWSRRSPAQIVAAMEPAYLPQPNVPQGQLPTTPQTRRDYLRPVLADAENKEALVAQDGDAVFNAIDGVALAMSGWGRLRAVAEMEKQANMRPVCEDSSPIRLWLALFTRNEAC